MQNLKAGDNDEHQETNVLEVREHMDTEVTDSTEELPKLQATKMGHAEQVPKRGWNVEGRPEWVYIARSECRRYVKIGITTSIQWKLQGIAGAWRKMMKEQSQWHFLAILPGSLDLERAILSRFARHRYDHGDEWFNCCEEIIQYAWLAAVNACYPDKPEPLQTPPKAGPGRGHKGKMVAK